MLQISKLFLLLITCVALSFACTSSKKKSSTAPTIPIGGGSQSEQIKEMEDKLNKALDKVDAMQAQVGQGKVSQKEFEEWQDEVKTAQDDLKTAQAELEKSKGGGGNVSDIISDMNKKIKELEEKIEEKKGDVTSTETKTDETKTDETKTDETKTDETKTDETKTDETKTDETKTEGEPTITIAMRELKEEETETITNGSDKSKQHTRKEGTYVTFHSDKDVVIKTIKYGKLTFTPDYIPSGQGHDDIATVFNIQLPVYVKFTHANKPYCVTATIDQDDLPGAAGDKETVEEMTEHEMTDQECKP